MLKIYFDGTLLNSDYYTELTNKDTLFDKSFYLGSTAANSFSISLVKEAVSTIPEVVTIYDDTELIATLQVDNVEENDDGTITYELIDYMVNLDGFTYNAKPLIDSQVQTTILEILEDICDQAGITLATQSFINDDLIITWYDDRISARDYVSYIAEIAGGYARINASGELEIIAFSNTSSETISLEDVSGYKIGEHYKITKVVYDDEVSTHYEAGDETGNVLYLNQNNVYITSQEILNKIYNSIKDFEFYNITIDNCEIDISNQVGSIITFTDGTNNYPTILGKDLTYNGTWLGGYTLQLETEKQSETNISGSSDFYKNVETRLNRDENTIEFLAEQIQEVSNEITGAGTLNYTNAADVPIHQIIISGEASLPVVRSNENDPFVLIAGQFKVQECFKIQIIKNNEVFKTIKLPFKELRYLNSEVKDTFEILETEGTYTKRVGVDYNGDYYELADPIITTYSDLQIDSPGGNFNLTVIPTTGISLYSKYLLQNDYTTSFATKAYVQSSIDISQDEVLIESKSWTADFTENYIEGTTIDPETGEEIPNQVGNQLIASINTKSTGQVLINASKLANISADKINLEGYTTINNGFTIDTSGNMSCQNANINGSLVTRDGVITNLIFPAECWGWYKENTYDGQSGNASWIGWNVSSEYDAIWQSFLNFSVRIPPNFIVESAKIYLRHTPMRWGNPNSQSQEQPGSCKNIKLYNVSGLGQTITTGLYNSYYLSIGGTEPTFGNPITNTNLTFSEDVFQEKETADFKNIFTTSNEPQTYNIVVKSSDTKTATKKVLDDPWYYLGIDTGIMTGYAEVIGYLNLNTENSNNRNVQITEYNEEEGEIVHGQEE